MVEPRTDGPGLSRRGALRGFAAAGGVLAWPGSLNRVIADDREPAKELALIVRNRMPLDAESPVEVFDRWITPNDLFFVRSHFGAPAVGLAPWSLTIAGLVGKSRTLALKDLERFEQVTVPAVLQCSGNGRGLFAPRPAGVGWERGAVGHAEWSGVRLKDLLEEVGLGRGAAHVQSLGSDAPPNPKTPAFHRSIPLEKALDPRTIVATRMNGEPLPRLHGGPLRLIVPAWTGNHWMKWLRMLTVADEEAPGAFQQTSYKISKAPTPPGVAPNPEDMVSLTAMNVKSLIARPSRGAVLEPGPVEVRGVAWTGVGVVTRVEVSVDGGPWQIAKLEGRVLEGSWRLWTFAWKAKAGKHALRVRATDSEEQTQPETPPWNKSGYLWNGIDEVSCVVR